jgi:type I restriction enzyme, S subunit
MTQNLWDIPDSWIWTTIGEIGKISSGSTPSTKDVTNFGGDYPWLTPADLSGFELKFIKRGKRNLTEKGLRSCSAKLLPAGTILFSSRAPIGYTVIASNPISTNQGFKNVTVHEGLFNEYVYHWLKGNKILAEEFASGTTFKELSAKRMKMIPIPIPPFNEQARIANLIEELFSKLNVGIKSLQSVQDQLKHYRQSTLIQAYTGKLTQYWRNSNPSSGNVDKLLEKIQLEGETQNEGGYSFSEIDGNEELSEIPKHWKWTSLGTITLNYDRRRIPVKRDDRKKMQGKYPYYGASGIIDYVDDYLFDGEYLLLGEDGANLISRATPIAFISKGQFWVNNHAHVLKSLGQIPIKFIEHYLNHKSLAKYVTGTAQPKLSQRNMNKISICVPPLEEQKEIVDRIESCFSGLDYIEKKIEKSIITAGHFKKSIFKKAYEGRLVPQDPRDEPGSVLLYHIKAQNM